MIVYLCIWRDVRNVFHYSKFYTVSDTVNWYVNLLDEGFCNASIYKTIGSEDEKNVG